MIIIIGGDQGAGKSRLAARLRDAYDRGFANVRTVDPMEPMHFAPGMLDRIGSYSARGGFMILTIQGSVAEATGRCSTTTHRGFEMRTVRDLWEGIVKDAEIYELRRTP